MNTVSIPVRIIIFFLIVLLSILIVGIAKLGIADLISYSSYQTLKDWQLSPFEISSNKWDRIRDNLEQAHTLDPDNPEILMYLGLAHEGRFSNDAIQLPEAEHDRKKALSYYRQSVKLRPTWPYG